jgi:uncharacterized protein YjiS (DUF1127 family)
MFGFLNRCRQSVARHHRRQSTIRRLADLDDRQLKDIGLNRADIRQGQAARLPLRDL